MTEQITVRLHNNDLVPTAGCETMNPKALLLYAGAKCAGLTVLQLLRQGRITPQAFEITLSGELNTPRLEAVSEFRSFHVRYRIVCLAETDRTRTIRLIRLAHERYCGTLRMLERIAPITPEYLFSAAVEAGV